MKMMFELNHLRSFMVVAAELNFRRAAKYLNMTQPPLSRQIQLLERHIGVSLFDRSSSKIRLTAAGQRLLAEAQDLIGKAEAIAQAARMAESGDEGRIVLGYLPTTALELLPRIVSTLRVQLPNADLVLKEMSTLDQVKALTSGTIDLGIIQLPPERDLLHLACLWREPYVLAIHKNHPLAGRERWEIDNLHGENFLMFSASEGWYDYEKINTLFVTKQIKPRFVQFLDQSLAILSLINAGEGIALVPKSLQSLDFRNVLWKQIELSAEIFSEYYLCWTTKSLKNPVISRAHGGLVKQFDACLES